VPHEDRVANDRKHATTALATRAVWGDPHLAR
jgi:hypothetical protein